MYHVAIFIMLRFSAKIRGVSIKKIKKSVLENNPSLSLNELHFRPSNSLAKKSNRSESAHPVFNSEFLAFPIERANFICPSLFFSMNGNGLHHLTGSVRMFVSQTDC